MKNLNAANDGLEYDVPSEAQWEYAARAGAGSDAPTDLDQKAWYKDISDLSTHAVGQKKPNAFGLYDTGGNVWEWVQDIFNLNGYYGLPTDGSPNLKIGSGYYHVLRGGGFRSLDRDTRPTLRHMMASFTRDTNFGFRIAARTK